MMLRTDGLIPPLPLITTDRRLFYFDPLTILCSRVMANSYNLQLLIKVNQYIDITTIQAFVDRKRTIDQEL
ncbi:hypothetical protein DMC15_07445 [Vibrio sp. 11986-1-5]|nr:hypothetical protein DMC15_07445 [Vibrio sp. 11986-1-5]